MAKLAHLGRYKDRVTEIVETIANIPGPENPKEFRKFYLENGFVIARGLISKSNCDSILSHFQSQVKSYDGLILRQATFLKEKHLLSPSGLITNAILGIPDLEDKKLEKFRAAVLDAVSSNGLPAAISSILEKSPKVVETMFFEGNSLGGTAPHMDSYFMDSEKENMIGAWIAMEDIPEDAGRFFVYPKSHLLESDPKFGDQTKKYKALEIGTGQDVNSKSLHENIKRRTAGEEMLVEILQKADLKCFAPALNKGDILFWGSKTVHGSLRPNNMSLSRRSLNVHFVGARDQMIYHGMKLQPESIVHSGLEFCLHPSELTKKAG